MRIANILVAAALLISAPLSDACGGQIEIRVRNEMSAGGFGITPVWAGFHDGSFEAFTPGTNLAGSSYRPLAELGITTNLANAFGGLGPQTVVGSSPILPGMTVARTLNVADPAATPMFDFASMVIPSNDFFIGSPSNGPLTIFDSLGRIIDGAGNLASSRVIRIFGRMVWDAGTEVDNSNFGAAFLVGVNEFHHTPANSTARLVFGGPTDYTAYFASLNGRATHGGYSISQLFGPDDLIATIRITAVPEPSNLVLSGFGLAGAAVLGARRRSAFARRFAN
ncbi:MAG: spondin domain-containing protein [Isosphaeraceae bacterium]|nr:spondin domain-containing protein [Isosphaeraceae bacterium]